MIPTLALLATLFIILIWANSERSTVTPTEPKKLMFKKDHDEELRKLKAMNEHNKRHT